MTRSSHAPRPGFHVVRPAGLALALLASAGLAPPGAAAPPAQGPRVVIVLDASLSMVVRQRAGTDADAGDPGPRRLDVAWRDLRRTVEHLARREPGARVRVIAFGPAADDDASGLLEFPREPGAFLEARAATALEAWWSETLSDRAPRGPSRLDLALQRALALAPDRVLCYTDGVPLAPLEAGAAGAAPVTDTAAVRIERARARILADVRFWNRATPVTPVDVVGVGAGLQGTRAFLQELATQTGGYFVATD